MAKFKRLVLEGVTPPVLYHVTSAKNAANVLKKDEFVLSQAYFGGRDLEFQKGNYYFLSTSRVKYGGYAQGMNKAVMATLTLDGRKIGNRFETVSANFFEGGQSESEERILHDDPTISGASKYIDAVHVFIDRKRISSKQQQYIKFLHEFGEDASVPVYFYDNKEYWLSQRSEFSLKIEDFETEDFPMFLYGKDVKLKDDSKAFIDGELDDKLRNMDRTEVRRFIEPIADNIEKAFKEPRYNDYKRKFRDRLNQFGADTASELAIQISQKT